MNRQLSKAIANIFLSSLVIIFTSCEEITQVGRNTDSTLLYKLSQLANWSLLWLIPPVIIYFLIARDRDEMTETVASGRTFSGKYETIFTKVPTGRIIKGDPEAGLFIAILYIACYPIGYLYFGFLHHTGIYIEDNFTLKIIIFIILIPAILVTLIGITIHKTINDKKNPLSKLLTNITFITVGFCYLNMICWLAVTYM